MKNLITERKVAAKLVRVTWESIYLHLQIALEAEGGAVPEDVAFYLVTAYGRANALFEVRERRGNLFELVLNITNAGYSLALPEGTYRIAVCAGDEILAEPVADEALATHFGDCSRFFSHNNRRAYCVAFELEEAAGVLYPVIRTWDTEHAFMPEFTHDPRLADDAKSANRWRRRIRKYGKKALQKQAEKYYRSLHRRLRKRHKKKHVLFMSEQNEAIAGNLLFVSERMKERGLTEEFEISYSTRSAVAKKDEYGLGSWRKTIRKIADADLIFTDDHVPMFDWMHLAKDTKLVQLWHAGAGYKASGYARWGHDGGPAPFSCHRQYAYAIAESRNVAAFHAECFGINVEQVLVTGMPRIDQYLNKAHQEETSRALYERYPACRGRRVILFAPTFRGNDKASAFYPCELIDFDGLYRYCQEKDAVVLFKLHPWIAERIAFPQEYGDRFFDAADYPKINDLFYITDVLISDYSSGVFEYSLMNRPALFFAFDAVPYAYTRGFHRDYESSIPGKLCRTFAELLTALRTEDYEFEKMASYLKFHFDQVDEGATDRVIDWIVLDQMPEDVRTELETMRAQISEMKQLDFTSFCSGIE